MCFTLFSLFSTLHLHHQSCFRTHCTNKIIAQKYTTVNAPITTNTTKSHHFRKKNIYRCCCCSVSVPPWSCASPGLRLRPTVVNESVMPCTISLRTRSIATPTGTAEVPTPTGSRRDPEQSTPPLPATARTRRRRGRPGDPGPAMHSTTKTSRTVSSATSAPPLPARRPPRPLYIIVVVALVSSPRQRIPAAAVVSSWATVGTYRHRRRRWPPGTASNGPRTT